MNIYCRSARISCANSVDPQEYHVQTTISSGNQKVLNENTAYGNLPLLTPFLEKTSQKDKKEQPMRE
jgi:hypothetical protein